MKIIIGTKKKMRYDTAGDYYYDKKGNLHIESFVQDNPLYEKLIAIHELIEEMLTKHRGIKEKDITKFDKEWSKKHSLSEDIEPGDAPDCIYKREHRFSENIERAVAHELGIDWSEYNDNISYPSKK